MLQDATALVCSTGNAEHAHAARYTHAGAPLTRSATWCFNPQFRVTVRKPCEVVVCLGQQDPRVEAGRHTRKGARRRSVALMVRPCALGHMQMTASQP